MWLLLACTDYAIGSKTPGFDSGDGADSPPVDSVGADSEGGEETGAIGETDNPCPDTGAFDPIVSVSAVEVDPDATDPVCSDVGDVSWEMQVEWTYPLADFVMGPVAAPNGGRPGASVFVDTEGYMVEVDGRDGSEIQRLRMIVPNGTNDDGSTPAVNDIDGDGDIDFVAPTVPFVHVVDSGAGTEQVFDATPTSGYAFDDEVVQFADVDLDGAAEVVLAASVFELDGTRLASTVNCQGTQTFVTDLDGDWFPEWVNTDGIFDARDGSGTSFDGSLGTPMYLYGAPIDAGGATVVLSRDRETWARVSIDGTFSTTPLAGSAQGLVAVGDVDGDKIPDAVMRDVARSLVVVMDADGNESQSWSFDGMELQAGGTSLADLDADGVYEIIVLRLSGVTILSGLSGEILAEIEGVGSAARDSAPLVLDVDGDGSAEIVVSGTGADFTGQLVAIGPTSGRWARTRPIWNQLAYDAASVHDDGTLAPFAEPGWQGLKAFRAQPGRDGALPDLSVELRASEMEVVCVGVLTVATFRVRNLGSEDAPAGAIVRLSGWDGATLTTLLEETVPEGIPVGHQVEVTWTGPLTAERLLAEVVPAGEECDPFDNQDEVEAP